MKDAIQYRFAANLDRVRSVVSLYDSLSPGAGRRPVSHTDLLRSAVVLLHASLEDALRGLAEWKLPSAPPKAFADLSLPGLHPRTKFSLDDLAPFRGQSVDDLLKTSILQALEWSNYNNPGEVKALFAKIEIDPSMVDPFTRKLTVMMKRRHLIVHRLDRNMEQGRGHHVARSLSKAVVNRWIELVVRFVTLTLDRV